MRVAAAQMDIIWEEPEHNLETAKGFLEEAFEKECDLILFPELFSTGVTLKAESFAQQYNGETCRFLQDAAKKYGMCVAGSFIEKNPCNHPFNTLVAFDDTGELLCKYSKRNLFAYGGEDTAYSQGVKSSAFNLGGFNISPFICYDLRFPTLFMDAKESMGVNFFIVTANWPEPRKDHWVTLLKARAIETQSYVLGVNQVGSNPENTFFGASMVVSPHGEVLTEDSEHQGLIFADIDVEYVKSYREKYNP